MEIKKEFKGIGMYISNGHSDQVSGAKGWAFEFCVWV
jgi:hypothetical protein